MRYSSLAAATAMAAQALATHCPCGYTLNATDQEDHALFTESLETDFLHVSDLYNDAEGQWIPQAFNATPEESHGPYGRSAQLGNVVPSPVGSRWDWSGPGVHGVDPGLQLFVRKDLVSIPDGSGDAMVSMAEIVSQRTDVLYGSFRIGMKATPVNGTCGASFFFYFNNSEEVDVEILSKQPGAVNLVVQSPESAAIGYVNNSLDFVNYNLAFAPSAEYNEFRFDWLPDRVEFRANNQLLRVFTDDLPNVAGAIHVNHWSNGNMGWSAGPPSEDAALTISYIKAYFNSSDPSATASSLKSCPSGQKSVCVIPDQNVPPALSGPNSNVTGRTFFFNDTAILKTHSNSSSGSSGPPKHGRGVAGTPDWRIMLGLSLACLGVVALSSGL